MNGRVYDPRLGRFLWVDPIISNPANTQSLNPYSYIGNNPLSGTDPTGYDVCPAGLKGSDGGCQTPGKPNSMVEARKAGSIAGRGGDNVTINGRDQSVTGWNASRPMNNGYRDAGAEVRTSNPINAENPAEVNAARQRLIAAQDEARGNPDFQPGAGGEGKTHCNQATCATVDSAAGPAGVLTRPDHKPGLANEQGARLATSPVYRKADPIEAQAEANRGRGVVGSWINPDPTRSGHIVTVRPTGVPGDNPPSVVKGRVQYGPIVNDVGSYVGVQRASGAFPEGAVVHYYVPKDFWSDAGASGYR